MDINSLLEKNIFPDWLIRIRIRQLLDLRIKQEKKENAEAQLAHKINYVRSLKEKWAREGSNLRTSRM